MASISTTTVNSSSWVKCAWPIIFLRHLFVDLISRSNIPPHHGAFSRLKCHSKEWLEQYRFTSGCVMTSLITLGAALIVLALSETITSGVPRLAQNLLRQRTNVSVDMSGTTSMWTARVTQHVYRQIHIFSLLVVPKALTCSGPAKSTAACENGLLSRTRNFGRGGGRGAVNGFPSNFLHGTHRPMIDLTVLLPFRIQYLDRISVSVSLTPL